MRKLSVFIVALLFLNIQPTHAVETLPQPFFNYLNSKYLGDPGVILIDKASGEVIYESGSTKARTPASVLKRTSAAAIALTLDANKRAYMPKLIKAAFASDKKLKKITLIYKGVNNSDIYYAKKALKRRASVAYKPLSKNIEVESLVTEKLTEVESPPLSKMIRFALLYSDNVLSQRLAMLATGKNGYPLNKDGLNDMANEKLTSLGIDTKGMKLVDGSGLSGANRVSAVTVSQLLLKIRSESQLKVVYDSLPVGGESGTLIGRYHTTAPQAVGIVKAKTGSTRHTVSLAGYTSAGEKEYVFVVIADGVGRTKRSQNAARSAIDRMLGTITKPVVIGLTPPTVENNPVTITQ